MGDSESKEASSPPASGKMSWRPFKSQPVSPILLTEDWRNIKWGEETALKDSLKKLDVKNRDVKYLRILVHGPVGAGKSSFINSISSIFEERMVDTATAEADAECSFTNMFNAHQIKDGKTRKDLHFVLCDVMGLEKGDSAGVNLEDLIRILQGQIKNNHKFNSRSPCSDKDPDFISNPTLSDEIHCLLSVIPADKVSLMTDDDFKKMREIRKRAGEMGIPQLAMLTKVDLACPAVQKDLKITYRSKKIKEKMQECSNKLGVTMNCIFPVKCYHEEIDLKPDLNVLLLSALKRILESANDYVERKVIPPANKRSSNSDP